MNLCGFDKVEPEYNKGVPSTSSMWPSTCPDSRSKDHVKTRYKLCVWQIPLSRESALLTTFITPYGRYCFYRLPFGIYCTWALSEENVRYLGRTTWCTLHDWWYSDLWQNTRGTWCSPAVSLQRLQDAGMTLNVDKCQFSKTSLKFLGHVIDNTGIRADILTKSKPLLRYRNQPTLVMWDAFLAWLISWVNLLYV